MTTSDVAERVRYQVFISSTYTDLVSEREAVTAGVLRMGKCVPAGMELFSASSQPPWDVIRRTLDDSDYVVLIIGNRLGSLMPGDNVSYTEREYQYAQDQGIPVLAFLSSSDRPMYPKHVEAEASRQALQEFRHRVQSAGLTEDWTTKEELASKVSTALYKAFEQIPRPGWRRTEPVSPERQSAAPARSSLPGQSPVSWTAWHEANIRYRLRNNSTHTGASATLTGFQDVTTGGDGAAVYQGPLPVELAANESVPFIIEESVASPSVTAIMVTWDDNEGTGHTRTLYI